MTRAVMLFDYQPDLHLLQSAQEAQEGGGGMRAASGASGSANVSPVHLALRANQTVRKKRNHSQQ
jgi:hypothetical protein